MLKGLTLQIPPILVAAALSLLAPAFNSGQLPGFYMAKVGGSTSFPPSECTTFSRIRMRIVLVIRTSTQRTLVLHHSDNFKPWHTCRRCALKLYGCAPRPTAALNAMMRFRIRLGHASTYARLAIQHACPSTKDGR